MAQLADWQMRVLGEKNDLELKLNKLGLYINHPNFAKLPKEEADLLSAQQRYMELYLEILQKRIARFPK